jgi:hypothetical protein
MTKTEQELKIVWDKDCRLQSLNPNAQFVVMSTKNIYYKEIMILKEQLKKERLLCKMSDKP